jgi:hypothetical protein
MMRVIVKLKSVSPYSQSRPIQSAKGTGESADAFEERTWRERLHVDENGKVFIPPMAIKNALPEAAKFLGESVPGKGKATWTKHFEAGLLIVDPVPLGIEASKVQGERLFVPADGVRGSGKRVWKVFPVIAEWTGTVEINVLDPLLVSDIEKCKKDVTQCSLYRHLEHAGKFIGIGRFRPRNNGFYGRFSVEKFTVENV